MLHALPKQLMRANLQKLLLPSMNIDSLTWNAIIYPDYPIKGCMHMLLVNYIPNVIYVHKRNFYVYYRKNEEICPQSHVNFLKAFQSMTFYGTSLLLQCCNITQN